MQYIISILIATVIAALGVAGTARFSSEITDHIDGRSYRGFFSSGNRGAELRCRASVKYPEWDDQRGDG